VPVGLGILLYHLADIAMRTVAFATFVYALSGWAWVALPLGLSAWLAVEQVLVLRGAERDMTLQELENTGRRLLGPSHVGKEHLRDRMTGKQPGGLRWEAVKKPRGDVRNRTLGEKPSAALAEHLRNKAADDQGTLWLLEAEWRESGVRSLRWDSLVKVIGKKGATYYAPAGIKAGDPLQTNPFELRAELASSMLLACLVTYVGLLPFMPHPHTEVPYLHLVYGLMAGGAVVKVLGFACSLFPATTGNYVALGTGYALGGAAGSSEVKVAAEGKGSSKELV